MERRKRLDRQQDEPGGFQEDRGKEIYTACQGEMWQQFGDTFPDSPVGGLGLALLVCGVFLPCSRAVADIISKYPLATMGNDGGR